VDFSIRSDIGLSSHIYVSYFPRFLSISFTDTHSLPSTTPSNQQRKIASYKYITMKHRVRSEVDDIMIKEQCSHEHGRNEIKERKRWLETGSFEPLPNVCMRELGLLQFLTSGPEGVEVFRSRIRELLLDV
jgi:hypothetical protein